jgi:hypothetical protein
MDIVQSTQVGFDRRDGQPRLNCFSRVPLLIGFFVVAVTALFSTATASAEVRVVALGDSGIRGKGVPESQAYPAQLEAALVATFRRKIQFFRLAVNSAAQKQARRG